MFDIILFLRLRKLALLGSSGILLGGAAFLRRCDNRRTAIGQVDDSIDQSKAGLLDNFLEFLLATKVSVLWTQGKNLPFVFRWLSQSHGREDIRVIGIVDTSFSRESVVVGLAFGVLEGEKEILDIVLGRHVDGAEQVPVMRYCW